MNSILQLVKLAFKIDRYRLDNKMKLYYDALENGNIDEAEQHLLSHLNKHANDEVALCELAKIRKSNGDIDESIRLFKKAVKSHVSYDHSRFLLGELYLELNDYKSAETYFYSAFNINQTSATAYGLGRAYKGLGRLKESQKYLKKAIKLNKYNHDAYLSLISIYDESDNEKEAEKYRSLLEVIDI